MLLQPFGVMVSSSDQTQQAPVMFFLIIYYFERPASSVKVAVLIFLSYTLNNLARRVWRGFHCSRQDFSHRAVLESRFSPALRFSWLIRHLSVLRKTGTWLLQCRPSTPTLYHTIDTHPESGNKRARFAVTNLYCYRVTLIIDWQITHCCKFLYWFTTFVIRCIRHIPYFHFSG